MRVRAEHDRIPMGGNTDKEMKSIPGSLGGSGRRRKRKERGLYRCIEGCLVLHACVCVCICVSEVLDQGLWGRLTISLQLVCGHI
jgi:hypothetical protein